MRKLLLSGLVALLFIGYSSISHCQEDSGSRLKFREGVLAGYNRGLVFQANITALNFAPEFPFRLRFGVGYTFMNPGDALDARRIFINNNTGGTPEKKGRSLDLRLDFLIPKTVFGISDSYLSVGPRFSTFKGNFVYVGGNEDFDITSHQWGIGAGLENRFKMTQSLDLVLSYGLDFYLPSTLTGHDTSYSPDNDNVNPRRDIYNEDVYFIYKDANKAVKQPMLMPRIMMGINFSL
jgi:hypothetical protein